MDPERQLWAVGLSHRTAPVAVRGRYVVPQAELGACMQEVISSTGVEEALVVSTCNRTEILFSGKRGADLVPRIRRHLFRNIADDELYVYEDVQAIIHLFRVAGGMDSVILGEGEVLGQLKRSIEIAKQHKTIGRDLTGLLQQALHVGKRIRKETEISRGSLSVAKVAVDLATRVVGRFEKSHALIIGAGETGMLVAQHLRDLKIGELCVANRTLEKAESLAKSLGAEAAGLDDLDRLLVRADQIFTCVDAGGFEIPAKAFSRRRKALRDRPIIVCDLSVPCVVEPSASEVPDVLLYNLDDIGRIVETNKKARSLAASGSSGILVAELHKFLSLRTYATFTPSIERLRERFLQTRDSVLDQIAGEKASAREIEVSHELARRLMDIALEQMKDSAKHTRSEEVLDREYRRFLENL